MPTAGGLAKSLSNGKAIGCTAVQVFTSSPRQWAHPPLAPEVADAFRHAKEEHGIGFTVAHDSYLINLAAPNPEVLERSKHAFGAELERAEALGIPWVVTHMGACMDSTEEEGIRLLCESLTQVLRETEGLQVGVALETTAGQGTCLGYRFEQIAQVVDGCQNHPRLGVCLDTCHIFVAGYDLRDEEAYQQTMADFDRVIGLQKLKVIHANDAKKPLGSRVDRHEHIGQGEIGIGAFERLVNDPRLLHVPIVIETPDADTMHAVNLAMLQELASGPESGIPVVVRLFGHYRDAEPEPFTLRIPSGSTVADLAQVVAARSPRLAGLDRICRVAVNEEYAEPGLLLSPGDTAAFIPPMSGGQ